jgi:hypothetical protein
MRCCGGETARFGFVAMAIVGRRGAMVLVAATGADAMTATLLVTGRGAIATSSKILGLGGGG